MATTQLTVLTENSAARLSRVVSHLSRQGIDVRAHCLVDNGQGIGKLRLIVNQPDRAVEILQRKKITAVVNEVVLVQAEDKPGAWSRILDALAKDDIQVEYTYTAASETPGTAVMVFRFSDNEKGAAILEKNGIRPFSART